MTSNLGSQVIKEFSQDYETMQREVLKILESSFRPEFLNRIDEIVIFRALAKATIIQIVDTPARPSPQEAGGKEAPPRGQSQGQGAAGGQGV